MSTTRRGVTQRTLAALALLILGLGTALIGFVGTASADPGGNGKGANQSGPYDPHNVGQGDNQGNGKAPANGTRGKADGKNPPGQVNNPHSKGYECNSNKGIGDRGGNPAHSGCATTAPGDGDGDGEQCPPGTDRAGQPLPDGQAPGTYCNIDTAPNESERPNPSGDGDGDADGDGPEVMGIEANAPAAGVAEAVPTAVAAGSADEASSSSTPWVLAGAALALAGLTVGLFPATRGRRSA